MLVKSEKRDLNRKGRNGRKEENDGRPPVVLEGDFLAQRRKGATFGRFGEERCLLGVFAVKMSYDSSVQGSRKNNSGRSAVR